jgi:serine/threonine protein phosphatase 1
MHRDFPKNENGRDFVVGDIHGCYDLLMTGLSELGFDRRRDRLFSVRDIIDRGPDSQKCLMLLDEPWFHMVLGNHEQMMIDFLSSGEGLGWLKEFGDWARKLRSGELNNFVKKLAKCPISMTINGGAFKAGICHAEPDGEDWNKSKDKLGSKTTMLWGRRVLSGKTDYDVAGIDITIHGHTPLDNPKWVGNRYFLDTGAWDSGTLTIRKISDIYTEFRDAKTLFG